MIAEQQPLGRRLLSHALTLATGLGAATPVIVACLHAIENEWVPIADRAIIATRAHDVFSSHTPLVGQYTLAGEVTGHVTHSLGPMLFWLLAIPAKLGSTSSMVLTIGLLNTLAILGSVALARRRGGRLLMFMSAIAILIMCRSLAAETFHDVWNPSVALFPFTLLIFTSWCVACGEYRLLPLTVLVGSFVVQAHLTYLPPTLGLLAVGLGGLAAHLISSRGRVKRRSLLIWGLATLAVGAICWSAPIVDELTEPHGNLSLVIEAAEHPQQTLGARVGWHAIVHAVGVVPWWLQDPHSRWQRKLEVRSTPSRLATWSTLALLCALLAVALAALSRRRGDIASLALISLTLCLALASVAARTPAPRLLSATLGYTMWWGSQAGMCAWLTLIWSGWLVIAGTAARVCARTRARAPSRAHSLGSGRAWEPGRARPAWLTASLLTSLLALGTTFVVASAVASNEKPDEHLAIYKPIRRLAKRLDALIPEGQTILLRGTLNIATMSIKPAIRYLLVERNVRPLAPGSFLRLGSWYELYDRPYKQAVYLSDTRRPPTKRLKLVAQESFTEGFGRHTIYAWLSTRPGR